MYLRGRYSAIFVKYERKQIKHLSELTTLSLLTKSSVTGWLSLTLW